MSPRIALHRGDLVIVDFRSVNPSLGVRPALVIQNDADNARMLNTIVAQVTSNIRRAAEPTQLLIDQQHPDWSSSGLHRPSVINCSNIYTAEHLHRRTEAHRSCDRAFVGGGDAAAWRVRSDSTGACLDVPLLLPDLILFV